MPGTTLFAPRSLQVRQLIAHTPGLSSQVNNYSPGEQETGAGTKELQGRALPRASLCMRAGPLLRLGGPLLRLGSRVG